MFQFLALVISFSFLREEVPVMPQRESQCLTSGDLRGEVPAMPRRKRQCLTSEGEARHRRRGKQQLASYYSSIVLFMCAFDKNTATKMLLTFQ